MSASAKPEDSAAAVPEGEAEAEAEVKGIGSGCELLYCGGTKFDTMDQKGGPQGRNLESPTRLRPLVGVDIRFVASGCTACHCVAVDANGQCYTWGRNEMGQLGHGDTLPHNLPTVVSRLSNYKTIKASVGKNHTVVVTDDGMSFSFGHNVYGQLGTGSISNVESSPVKCDVVQATNVACGADFTIWLSSEEGFSILSAGRSQFGQLGQGNNTSNATDSLANLTNEPKPKSIHSSFKNAVVKVACGTNHTVAVDSKGFVYTWGCGTYGRLGHGKQNDEWKPCPMLFFENSKVLPPNAVVSAGSASSACTAGGGLLYLWGNVTNTGDYWLCPKHVEDLSGWNIGCMATGNLHHIVATDDTCISWGIGPNGELGHGPNVLKSSENPKKIDSLQGMHVRSWRFMMVITPVKEPRTLMNHVPSASKPMNLRMKVEVMRMKKQKR
ncbi:unnamed protein product [Urochloa humidicola]